ncbi:MAG: response regulator [Ardenticatenaceae bacterium]
MNEKPKVLVVDDNLSVVEFIKAVLCKHNYEVITAQSGINALLLLEQEENIDVMLLDVVMFGLDGFDVLEIVNANPKTASIKVIMLSGVDRVADKVRAFSAGAVDYLAKPFEQAELIARIDTQVRVKRAEQERQALLAKTETLYRISRSLIGTANLPEILQVVVDGVVEVLPANRVTLITFNAPLASKWEEREVTHFVKGGPGQAWVERVSFDELWEGLSGWVLRELKPAFSPKGDLDPRESLAVQRRRLDTNCGSIIVVPLLYRQQIVGTMTAINSPDELDFTKRDVELMVAIANQAVVAIENARLFDALRQSEERTRLIIETAHQGIVTMDADGIITAWNAQAERIFGYSYEEAIGRNFNEMITPGDPTLPLKEASASKSLEAHRTAQKGPYIWASPLFGEPASEKPSEMIARHRDGHDFPVEVTISSMKLGEALAFSAFVHDISERKQAAEALQKAKEAAEAAAQAKTDFLANMSHEIRTPLNAIIGMSSLLLDTRLSEEQKDFVEITRTSGDALLTIINEILDFSKVDAGRLELEEQPFNLRDCVEEALDLLIAKANEKGLEMAYFIDPQTPLQVLGDVTRLRQILVNLISNAVKFTHQGEVVVAVGSQELENNPYPQNWPRTHPAARGAAQEGRQLYQLHFTVRDTGIGIPQDQMQKLFRSFSQIDASTTRKYGGTGLGLVISKRLVEMMGGSMWLESEVGVGSTFHFTILVEGTEGAQAPILAASEYSPIEQAELIGKRVLIVDDNETNRYILASQIESWGMIPYIKASGKEALAWLAAGEAVDLAILDMQMPEMDGLTLAQKIRELESHTLRPAPTPSASPNTRGGELLPSSSMGGVGGRSGQACPRGREANPLPLIMLTSLGWRSDKDSLEANESVKFAAHLTKPVKPSQLHDILACIFDNQETSVEYRSKENPESRFDPDMGQRHSLRILLAEDNSVNQKVALRLLERMGYRADVAANGLEVLAALQGLSYDVVLMDVQMPEMDGVDTTQYIRQHSDKSRQPRIVAMTANALKGDRERYLAAGMDDYISKPVRVEELVAALQRCDPKGETGPLLEKNVADHSPHTSPQDAQNGVTFFQNTGSLAAKLEENAKREAEALAARVEIINAVKEAVRAMVGDDNPEILAELIEIFLQDTAQQVTALRDALEQESLANLRQVAHTLKGSSASLGFMRLSSICLKLEQIIDEGTIMNATQKVFEVEQEYKLIENVLTTA